MAAATRAQGEQGSGGPRASQGTARATEGLTGGPASDLSSPQGKAPRKAITLTASPPKTARTGTGGKRLCKAYNDARGCPSPCKQNCLHECDVLVSPTKHLSLIHI